MTIRRYLKGEIKEYKDFCEKIGYYKSFENREEWMLYEDMISDNIIDMSRITLETAEKYGVEVVVHIKFKKMEKENE